VLAYEPSSSLNRNFPKIQKEAHFLKINQRTNSLLSGLGSWLPNLVDEKTQTADKQTNKRYKREEHLREEGPGALENFRNDGENILR